MKKAEEGEGGRGRAWWGERKKERTGKKETKCSFKGGKWAVVIVPTLQVVSLSRGAVNLRWLSTVCAIL